MYSAYYLYHYTDLNGLKNILSTGYIPMTRNGRTDSQFGTGVQLTSRHPCISFSILANNWDDGLSALRDSLATSNRNEYCFGFPKCHIPEVRKVGDVTCSGVWVYPDNLNLARKMVMVFGRNP